MRRISDATAMKVAIGVLPSIRNIGTPQVRTCTRRGRFLRGLSGAGIGMPRLYGFGRGCASPGMRSVEGISGGCGH